MIPINQTCHHCKNPTWREDLGASDRHWDGGFICADCVKPVNWCIIASSDGKTEWNAEFFFGREYADSLKHGEILQGAKSGKKYRVIRANNP